LITEAKRNETKQNETALPERKIAQWFSGSFLEGEQTGEEEGHNSAQHQDNLFPATCDCCSLSYLPNLKN
jgi:hypothetical protein